MKLGIALVGMLLTVSPPHAASLESCAGASHPWCVPGAPAIISQQVQFANAGANLVGTAYLPSVGNQLPAIVVLHSAGAPGVQWFDPTVFSQPTGRTTKPCTNPGLGNTGRNQFRGPGYIQDNVSLAKSFRLYRETALEARVEAFQLSNTPQFNNPNAGSISASNFGQVTSTLGSGQGSVNSIGGGRSLQGALRIIF